jgi:hypothetical protein
VRRAAFVLILAGCSKAYQPGSFAEGRADFSGEKVQVGCLDLAISRRPDMGDAAVLDYQFGNRCNHGALVDLARVRVVGRAIDGTERPLAPHDPRHELRPLELDARTIGLEAIAYPAQTPTAQVCVDVASIVHERPARWICFARSDESRAEEEA